MEGDRAAEGGTGRMGGTRGKSFAGQRAAEGALNINSQVN